MSFQKGCWILLSLMGTLAVQAEPLVIQNEVLKVTCQADTGVFRVIRADSDETLAEGQFKEVIGPARIVEVTDAFLGQGQAIAVAGPGDAMPACKSFPIYRLSFFKGPCINPVPARSLSMRSPW